MLRDGPQTYEEVIGAVSEAFSIPPSVAEDEDEEFVLRIFEARTARHAVEQFNRKDGTLSDAEQAVFQRLLDALDQHDEARGIPEEQ